MLNKKLFLLPALFVALLTVGCGNTTNDNPVAALTTASGTNTSTTTGTTTGTGTNVPASDYSAYIENTSNWSNTSGSSVSLSSVVSLPYTFTADDTNTNYDASTAVTYDFDALSSARLSASYSNGVLTIDEAGTYILKGTLNGHILVKKGAGNVTLVMNGVTINGQTHSAIYGKKNSPISIILADGTTNTLNDVASYTFDEDDEPSACIFSKSDITIKGNGTLNVNANCAVTDYESDGIQSKGDNGIVITGGYINITTKGAEGGKALKAKNNIAIKDGNLTLNAPDGCIKAKGFVYINGGTFNLTSTNGDLIKVENDWEDDSSVSPDGDFYMDGGTITGTAFGDGIQATDEMVIAGGNLNITTTNSTFYITDANGDDKSSKGIKSGCDNASGTLTIAGGNINLNTQDHAIKCKGPINIKGNPSISITASLKYKYNSNEYEGGKGITGEGDVTIGESGNPAIRIYDAEEGIESKTKLTIAGGDLKVKTWDDGLNVGGVGTDLNITGGTTYIYANGDGIDSNKNITMTGGTLVVNADTTNDNSAVDLDGTLSYSGGTLIAAGPSGMDNNKQNSGSGVWLTINGNFTKGQLINIQDSYGNEVLTFTPAQNCTSIKFGSSSLISGNTYNVYQGGSTTSSSSGLGVFTGGKYTAGTLLGSFTVNSNNATIGTSNGQMGGQPGQQGQMGEPPSGQPGQQGQMGEPPSGEPPSGQPGQQGQMGEPPSGEPPSGQPGQL